MRIERVTFRSRNDFHYVASCGRCGQESEYRDGYDDDYYCSRVLPDRCCPHCGLNERGETVEARAARYATMGGFTPASD